MNVECLGCGRKVRFGASALQAYATARKHKTQVLLWAGQYFVCKDRFDEPGCGHKGAKLYPVDLDFDPPPRPPSAPVAIGEYTPKVIDPEAWTRAGPDQRKRLIRRARG